MTVHRLRVRKRIRDSIRRRWAGYVVAALGTVATTASIQLITAVIHANNLSLLYLVVVLWVATAFSRGPALFAVVLSFLMYDFYFVPPIHSFAIAYPSGYVALGALLLAGLVTGQLAATVRRREQVALEAARRMSTLYELTQVAARPDAAEVPLALLRQLVETFASSGVHTATLYRPTAGSTLKLEAITHALVEDADHAAVDLPIYFAKAEQAWQSRACVAFSVPVRQLPPLDASYVMCVPLGSSDRFIGVLGVMGTHAIYGPTNPAGPDPLFAAYRDQLTLALEHDDLQREAVHVAAQRESAHLKEAFLAAITHDLRTPLAAIQTVVESGLQPSRRWKAADLRAMLIMIGTSTQRLMRLVDNVLVLSRLEANAMPTVVCWYPIDELIATVREQLELAGLTAGRELAVAIQDDIVLVPLDHSQMERVLLNLLENALKYSPPGSAVYLQVRTCDTNTVEFRVRDEGIGIPPSERKAIFDKFYRLSPDLPWKQSSAPQGTGLGLAICASVVRAHGGHIWVEGDQGGEGTTFVVALPRPAHDAQEAQRYEEFEEVMA